MKYLSGLSIILCKSFLLVLAISLAQILVGFLRLLVNSNLLTSFIALLLFILYNELFSYGYKELDNSEEELKN